MAFPTIIPSILLLFKSLAFLMSSIEETPPDIITGQFELSADSSNCPVIISGGVSSIDDIKKAKDLNNSNIEGIIVGKAIYDGDIKLDELVTELDA